MKHISYKEIRNLLCLASAVPLLLTGCASSCVADEEAISQIPEEDKLIVYTSHKEEVYGPIIREFEEETGIWVEVHAGGTTEMMEKIHTGKAGECDIMFGGGVESYDTYSAYFEPYRCSEIGILDDTYLSEEDLWTPFTELPIVFIYNNKLVSDEATPQCWEDLFEEKWRGKIAFAAPGKSGTSYTALATMLQVLGRGEEPLEEFISLLDGNISDGSGEVLDEVSTGKRLVGITIEESAKKKIANGEDLSVIYPKDGTSAVPDGCALVKGAKHKENAKRFIDFTVSEDIQHLAVDRFYRRSVRKDLQEEGLKEEDEKEVLMIDFDLDRAGENQERICRKWDELTGYQGDDK